MRVLGRTRTFRATITEPEPGRMLVETIPETGMVTTFLVEPAGDGARVAISTDFETRGGLSGRLERFFITRLLRPVYEREIEQLGTVASGWAKTRQGGPRSVLARARGGADNRFPIR
jgi:hypothetical protein